METLSTILASFDLFQVIFSAFPGIFMPIAHAFQNLFTLLTEIAGKQFASHPGLVSGIVMFFFVYLTWTGLSKLRRIFIPVRPAAKERSM